MTKKATPVLLLLFILFMISLACSGSLGVIHPTETSSARKPNSNTSSPDIDTLYFSPPDDNWIIGYDKEKPGFGGLTEYIREGDHIENWQELFTFEDLVITAEIMNKYPTPQLFFKARFDNLDKECPSAYTSNVIDEIENRIIYEIQRIQECEQWPYKQDEIGGIYMGRTHIFSIRYAIKADQMPSDTRQDWIDSLTDVELKLAGSSSQP